MPNEVAAIFADAGCDGFLHAREVDGDGAIGHQEDQAVLLASVFKIPVLLELAIQSVDGKVGLTDRVHVTPAQKVTGPTGISVMQDEVELSVRDLALWMMCVSDNSATDILMEMVGLDAINARLESLGLKQTRLAGDCGDILGSLVEDVGAEHAGKPWTQWDPEVLASARSMQPDKTSSTTPAEMTQLLAMIWRDEAGPPDACAEARRIMALQVWPHRLRSGFPGGVRIAAKTGTLPGARNEAGVVTYPDGDRYAVGVFTRAHTLDDPLPAVDAAIGQAARVAVEHLRAA